MSGYEILILQTQGLSTLLRAQRFLLPVGVLSPGLVVRSAAQPRVSNHGPPGCRDIGAASDLGSTRDQHVKNASRINPTCGLRDASLSRCSSEDAAERKSICRMG